MASCSRREKVMSKNDASSIAMHGPRSDEHLRQILAERHATKHLARPMTDADWEDIKKRVQARVETARRR